MIARPESPGAAARKAEDALLEIAKALRACKLYPSTHPARSASLERCAATIRALLPGDGLQFSIGARGFTVQGAALALQNAVLRALAEDLFRRRARLFEMTPQLTAQDLLHLVELLSLDVEEVRRLGGAAQILRDRGVQHIRIEESAFEKLIQQEGTASSGETPEQAGFQAREERVEAEVGEVEPAAAAELTNQFEGGLAMEAMELQTEQPPMSSEAEASPEAGKEAPSAEPAPKLPPSQSAQLDQLLSRLEAEQDPRRYMPLAGEVLSLAQSLYALTGLEAMLGAPVAFARHASPEVKPDAEIRARADEALRALCDPAVVDDLITRVARGLRAEEQPMLQVLAALGDAPVPAIVRRLLIGDPLQRSKLLPLVAGRTEALFPLLAGALSDRRWEMAQNAAAVIAELGGPGAVQCLRPGLAHPDIRVKRAAVRGLGRIGTREAGRLLTACLGARDHQLCLEAIAALGAMGDRAAAPALLRLVGPRSTRSWKFQVRREAIRALGRIGGEEVVEPLAKVLRSRSWLRRARVNELRVAAAAALAEIGSFPALRALEAAATDRHAPVREICQRALRAAKMQPGGRS